MLVRTIERRAHARVDSLLAIWRTTGISPEDAAAAQQKICAGMFREYKGASGAEVRPQLVRVEVAPNPARGEVRISAESRGPMEIFDLTGRRVASLSPNAARGSLFRWDRREEGGALGPAGIYFCRPRGESGPAARLVILP